MTAADWRLRAVREAAERTFEALGPARANAEYADGLGAELARAGVEIRRGVPILPPGRDCGCRIPLVVEGRFVVDLRIPGEPCFTGRPRVRLYILVGGYEAGALVDFHVPLWAPQVVAVVVSASARVRAALVGEELPWVSWC